MGGSEEGWRERGEEGEEMKKEQDKDEREAVRKER